ncbi:tRNA (guanosine(46)-N7)-methyltransferase TrmB [Mycobacterium sp. ST-F2]|uniref:tRNA (guanosine(46)-N7)-methyltransferase TrmB n=1 Tax=Mycobacterium sp. ST-F2 TaxID=1490484 RepID=UPI000AF0D80D|nr:tRNA (guanosine(46)-N7)-methyltransferase TrmB [Mycobacterium sp. ST-F2]
MYAQREDTGASEATGEDDAASSAGAPSAEIEPAAETTAAPTHQHRRVTSFRSRRSSLSTKQQSTWDRRWPELGKVARSDDGEPAPLIDTAAWFGRTAPVVLEIGSGTGISTLAMAQEEPHLDVIAVEVYRKGLAQLLGGVDRAGLTNVRFVRGDGVDVLEHMIAPGTLTAVRVFFPDPWPKARHHKRRLLQAETVALISSRLKPGGILHAATDHADYAVQIAEVGDAEPTLKRTSVDADLPISVQRPTTKYEARGMRMGSPITELIWERL